ncbi:hypothetical protein [Actinopolyspora mortivallis]|uniref:Uncharacterized protein n=1 Tax=Actinopolyspora mortivallis TaxID=33906 RepID=A0A2T0GUE0_ACTMO|nr:hypothetical protein [Actinopolyspora mortivallis]PRW62736.1 hypothetical protein CEP50_14055 [Actinopolyspora mortivallis]
MTDAPTWSVIAHDADRLRQAVRELDTERGAAAKHDLAREVLRTVTVIGERLTDLVDGLAKHYEKPGVPEQRSAYLAMDQAAAAAEDLGECARRAIQTLEEEE